MLQDTSSNSTKVVSMLTLLAAMAVTTWTMVSWLLDTVLWTDKTTGRLRTPGVHHGGDNGYILMARNHDNQCGVATSACYAKA